MAIALITPISSTVVRRTRARRSRPCLRPECGRQRQFSNATEDAHVSSSWSSITARDWSVQKPRGTWMVTRGQPGDEYRGTQEVQWPDTSDRDQGYWLAITMVYAATNKV